MFRKFRSGVVVWQVLAQAVRLAACLYKFEVAGLALSSLHILERITRVG